MPPVCRTAAEEDVAMVTLDEACTPAKMPAVTDTVVTEVVTIGALTMNLTNPARPTSERETKLPTSIEKLGEGSSRNNWQIQEKHEDSRMPLVSPPTLIDVLASDIQHANNRGKGMGWENGAQAT